MFTVDWCGTFAGTQPSCVAQGLGLDTALPRRLFPCSSFALGRTPALLKTTKCRHQLSASSVLLTPFLICSFRREDFLADVG